MATTNINNNGDELATKLVLPEDIIFQILLWLPVVSLLRFKSVCKSWYSLIKSSRFILQHNNKGTQEDEENYNKHKLLILQSHPSGLECKLISSSSHDSGGGDGVDDNNTIYQASENLDIPEFLSIYNFSELRDAKMISCKGIICFLHYNWNVSLWNPATKQFRVLPESQIPLPGQGKGFKLKIGFGFDAETNDYKVVRFLYSIQNFHADDCRYYDHVEVYSLSTNSWKTLDIGFSITHVEKDSEPKMPFRNGEIYCWVGAVDWHRFCLLTFNFRTEVFDTIPLPDDPTFRLYRAPRLDILKEKVVILLNVEGDTTALPYNFNYQIWVMNEYGVKDSWSKVYTVGPFSFISKSIGFAMNGNLLLSVMDEERYQQLCLCDLVTQQITKLPGQDSRLNIGAAVYKECLCSEKIGVNPPHL